MICNPHSQSFNGYTFAGELKQGFIHQAVGQSEAWVPLPVNVFPSLGRVVNHIHCQAVLSQYASLGSAGSTEHNSVHHFNLLYRQLCNPRPINFGVDRQEFGFKASVHQHFCQLYPLLFSQHSAHSEHHSSFLCCFYNYTIAVTFFGQGFICQMREKESRSFRI